MTKVRDKLKSLDLRITDLAYFMGVSRPTLYKIIDDYEAGRSRSMKKSDADLCRFIMKRNTDDKKIVIRYLLESEQRNELGHVARLVSDYERKGFDEKVVFIKNVLGSKELDVLIPYLNFCMESLEGEYLKEYWGSGDISFYLEFKDRVLKRIEELNETRVIEHG